MKIKLLDADDGSFLFGEIHVTPKLLNPGEWFDLQYLSERPHGQIDIACRANSQSSPMRSINKRRKALTRRLSILGLALLTAAFGIGMVTLVRYELVEMTSAELFNALVMAVLAILGLVIVGVSLSLRVKDLPKP